MTELYLVFGGDNYFPGGVRGDYRGGFAAESEALVRGYHRRIQESLERGLLGQRRLWE